jgi:hypothetical protein
MSKYKIHYPIRYTEKSLWEAIYVFVPGYKVAKESGSFIGAPMACKDALFQYYLDMNFNFDVDFDAGALVKTAYVDLMNNSMFNYAED